STAGAFSRGIDTRLINPGAATTTIVNTGDITTTGGGDQYFLGARAISVNTYGSGNISIDNSGALTTSGQFSRGIHAYTAATGTADIDVVNSGIITTSGDDAEGIQLFGTSTGSTSLNNSGNISTSGDRSAAIVNFVGEFVNLAGETISPPANDGLSISNSGNLSTTGANSNGIASIAGVSGDITITNSGDITTEGVSSSGIRINRFAGDGNASVTSTGTLSTVGDDSYGVSAVQTGGLGDVSIASTGNIATLGTNASAIIAFIGYDGSGNIDLTSTGILNTTGNNSYGIAVRNDSIAGTIDISNDGNITTSGSGVAAIYGLQSGGVGNVTITSTGGLTSTGVDADGIRASTTSGAVTVSLLGGIVSGGTGAGAGVNFTSGVGITSTLNTDATSTISSLGGTAVLGGEGDEIINNIGTITGNVILGEGTNVVNNADGATITGDLTTGAGNDVFANDGTFIGTANLGEGNNTVTNTSFFTFVGDLITGDGDDDITNTGVFQGTIDLGNGANAALNDVGGVLETTEVSVGAGNTFTNSGTLSPGGGGDAQTLTIDGNFTQTETGILVIEVGDTSDNSDIIVVNGDAEINGEIQIEVAEVSAGPQSFDIISATGDIIDNGIEIVAGPGLQVEFDGITLTTQVDFTATDVPLTSNQTNLGNALNGALAASIAGFDPIFDSLFDNIIDDASFQGALNNFSGEIHASSQFALNSNGLFVGDSITNLLDGLALPERGGEINQSAASTHALQALALAPGDTAERLFGADLVLNNEEKAVERDENYFVFGRGLFRDVQINADGNGSQTDIQNRGFIVGGGFNFDDRFQVGLTAGYLNSDVEVDALNSEVDADSAIFSAFGRFTEGAFDSSATFGYIYSGVDSERGIAVGALASTASAQYDTNTFFGNAELGYTVLLNDIALRPFVSGGFSATDHDGFTETGAGAANLAVASQTNTIGQFSVGASASTSFLIKSALIVPRIEVAYDQLIGDVTPGSTSQFQLGGAAFTVVGTTPSRSRGRVNAGVASKFTANVTGFLDYQGIFSSNDTEHSVRSGLRFKF
ncbi:MAG: autotransporter domain-containing protein, partial [Hyphomicrobiales bacterium]